MRIRTIKPSFFLHGELFDTEVESGLPVRLAYAGLWCASDREGRFAWKPRELKAQILPHDDVDFSRVLDALATRGFVVKYESGGKFYGWIPSFSDHQVVNNKESASVLPDPCDATTSTRAPRVPHACPTPLSLDQGEGKGREGKGREKEGKGNEVATRLLSYLNEKCGRDFRAVDTHLKLIASRLSEPGVTEEGVRVMIDRQCALWINNPQMADYLRPQTLFGKEKFSAYYDSRKSPIATGGVNGIGNRPSPGAINDYGVGGLEGWREQRLAALGGDLSDLAGNPFPVE